MLGLDQFIDHCCGRGESNPAFLPAGGYGQSGEQMGFTGAARNRHTLLSFHGQSSFTIDGIRYSARRCSRNAGTGGRAAREACARCQLTESPEVSLSALFELGATLDALPLTRPYSTISSETHLLEEEAGEDGAKTRECRLESPAARAGVGGAHRLGTSTGADPASASRRIGATADATRGRRGCGGGGR